MMEFLNNLITKFVIFITAVTASFFENLSLIDYSPLQVVIDIVLVAILFYWLIMLVRGTRATNILFGLFILALVFFLSRSLQLLAVGFLLERLLTVALVAIPIIFQQELRRGLEKLGRTKFFLAQKAKELDIILSEIIEACFGLAKTRRGALVVLGREVNLQEYLDTGIAINGKITKELLLSIFSQQSPLHDGAVVIGDNLIVSAGCVLPHSFKNYGHTFGTRHKAALGVSEVTDAKVIVVSEERGTVSFVESGGMEEDISPERLHELLMEIFQPKRRVKKSIQSSQRSQ